MGLQCIDIACGAQHCAAISGEGIVFTWGNGGYGRLGHKDQKNLFTPKPIMDECRAKQVSCGSASTAMLGWPILRSGIVCVGAPTLFMCGKVRAASQNAWMYPKPEDELRGWNLHTLALGAAHNVVHADESVISWGSGCQCGELGLTKRMDGKGLAAASEVELPELPGSGLTCKKSSAAPAAVDRLQGVSVAQIACGVAHTILLVESDGTVESLPLFEPAAAADGEAGGSGDANGAGGGGAQGKGKGKAAAKASGKRAAEPAGGGKAKKSK